MHMVKPKPLNVTVNTDLYIFLLPLYLNGSVLSGEDKLLPTGALGVILQALGFDH